jgi:hypothetical protein
VDFASKDCRDYPGSEREALKVDFEALRMAAGKIGVHITAAAGGSYFSAERRSINIDTRTPNRRGFVSVGQLTDEYLHAWNQIETRGKFLDTSAANEHRRLGRIAERLGTKALVSTENVVFHKLEALNFVCSGHPVPGFMWRVPYDDVRTFAYSWATHF